MSACLQSDTAPPTPTAQGQRALDLGHLARFTLGDEGLEREVLGLFLGETPRRIEAFRAASTGSEWKMAAHTLKGSARAVGAWRLALAAQLAESLGDLSDREACEQAIRLIELAALEVEAEIRVHYPPFAA